MAANCVNGGQLELFKYSRFNSIKTRMFKTSCKDWQDVCIVNFLKLQFLLKLRNMLNLQSCIKIVKFIKVSNLLKVFICISFFKIQFKVCPASQASRVALNLLERKKSAYPRCTYKTKFKYHVQSCPLRAKQVGRQQI